MISYICIYVVTSNTFLPVMYSASQHSVSRRIAHLISARRSRVCASYFRSAHSSQERQVRALVCLNISLIRQAGDRHSLIADSQSCKKKKMT